ncbi:MAG: exodeoxyribonuclease III [Acidobacteria bacterium]|nr:exodeoxyribonuclease III [Acidobacteriota bacterium]MBK8150209.1 exodeoxyribonuclease III [Acidobacteriota bacterium]MBK8810006.1 exodeoxyribonuclease III [Acidobacteriota bacterium]
MKVATWNVNSIAIRLEAVLQWLETTKTDVLCLQETKCVDDKFPQMDFLQAGYNAVFMGEKSYNGVAILSRHAIEKPQYNFADDAPEAPKRLIAATIEGVRIVNTYIPNGTELWSDKFTFKLDWLQRLRRMFDNDCPKDSDVLLCGDFNVAPEELDVWSVKNWEGKLHFSKPERAAIHHVKQWGFTDVFRRINGDLQEFSWWNYREGAFPRNQGLRIDHIWTSDSLAAKCTNCWIDREPRTWERPSDHTPVVAEFSA